MRMKPKMKKKGFDCVEMMHRGGQAVRAIIGRMTPEEESAYWQKRTHELREEVETLRRKARRKTPGPRR